MATGLSLTPSRLNCSLRSFTIRRIRKTFYISVAIVETPWLDSSVKIGFFEALDYPNEKPNNEKLPASKS